MTARTSHRGGAAAARRRAHSRPTNETGRPRQWSAGRGQKQMSERTKSSRRRCVEQSPTPWTVAACRHRLRQLAVTYRSDPGLRRSAEQVLAILAQRDARQVSA